MSSDKTEKTIQGAMVPGIKPELPEKVKSGFQAKARVVIPGYDSSRVDKNKWYDCYNLEKRAQNGNAITFYIISEQGNYIFCIEETCAVLGGQKKVGDDITRAAWEIRVSDEASNEKRDNSGSDKAES